MSHELSGTGIADWAGAVWFGRSPLYPRAYRHNAVGYHQAIADDSKPLEVVARPDNAELPNFATQCGLCYNSRHSLTIASSSSGWDLTH